MKDKKLPLPGELKIPSSLLPMVKIVASMGKFRLEVRPYTPPSFLISSNAWEERRQVTIAAVEKSPEWSDFGAAYDYVREQANAFPEFSENNLLSSESPLRVNKHVQVTDFAVMDSSTSRMFINSSSHTDSEIIAYDWDYFLDAYERYVETPQDFYASYEMVNSHPMFWKLHGNITGASSVAWDTLVGFETIHHTVFQGRSAGDIVHQLEGGPATCEPNGWSDSGKIVSCIPRRISSLDTKLSVSAETYELVVIAFARKIFEHYSLETAGTWLHGCDSH